MMPIVLQYGERDSWVGVLLSALYLIVLVPIVYFVSRRTKQQHVVQFVKERSSFISWRLFQALLFIYLTIFSYVTLFSTVTWTTSTYLTLTPNAILALPYLLLCAIAAYYGIRTIAFTAGILLPIVVGFGFLVAAGNFKEKDYSLLLPIFEHGYSETFLSSYLVLCGFTELIFLLLIQQHSSTKLKKSHLYTVGFLLFGLALGPLVGSITIFGIEEAQRMKYPAFSQWRVLVLGEYLTRLDFFSIFQWLAGAFTRQAIALYVAVDMLQIKSKKGRVAITFILAFLLWLTVFIPFDEPVFVVMLTNVYMTFSFVVAVIILVWLLVASLRKKKRSKRRSVKDGAAQ